VSIPREEERAREKLALECTPSRQFDASTLPISRMSMRQLCSRDRFTNCVDNALHKSRDRDDQSNQEEYFMDCYAKADRHNCPRTLKT
jgi:hypothetical protein